MEDVYFHQYVKIAMVSHFLGFQISYCTMIIKLPINRHTLEAGWLMQPERLASNKLTGPGELVQAQKGKIIFTK